MPGSGSGAAARERIGDRGSGSVSSSGRAGAVFGRAGLLFGGTHAETRTRSASGGTYGATAHSQTCRGSLRLGQDRRRPSQVSLLWPGQESAERLHGCRQLQPRTPRQVASAPTVGVTSSEHPVQARASLVLPNPLPAAAAAPRPEPSPGPAPARG